MKGSQFLETKNLARLELGTHQLPQLLRASLAILSYEIKDASILRLFHVFYKKNLLVTLCNKERSLKLLLDYSEVKARLQYEISVTTAFEAQLYFPIKALMSKEVIGISLKIVRIVLSFILVGTAVHLVLRTWMHL